LPPASKKNKNLVKISRSLKI